MPSLLGDVLDRERMSENVSQNLCQRAFDTGGAFRNGLPPRLDASSRKGEISPFRMRLPSVKYGFANSIQTVATLIG